MTKQVRAIGRLSNYIIIIILFIYRITYYNSGYKWTPQEDVDMYMLYKDNTQ